MQPHAASNVRGRPHQRSWQSSRATSSTSPMSAQPYNYRASRPRPLFTFPQPNTSASGFAQHFNSLLASQSSASASTSSAAYPSTVAVGLGVGTAPASGSPRKSQRLGAPRVAPTSAVVSTIALAFVLFAVIISRNVGSFILASDAAPRVTTVRPWHESPAAAAAASSDKDRLHRTVRDDDIAPLPPPPAKEPAAAPPHQALDAAENLDRVPRDDDSTDVPVAQQPQPEQREEGNAAPPPPLQKPKPVAQLGPAEQPPAAKQHVEQQKPPAADAPKPEPVSAPQQDPVHAVAPPPPPPPPPPQQQQQAAESGGAPLDAYVSHFRSWPANPASDVTKLIPLAEHLGFTNRTFLNYFHMHKTGGVSVKVSLMVNMRRYENRIQMNLRGTPIKVNETCYEVAIKPNDVSETVLLETTWRCDFNKIASLSQPERNNIDVLMGHQYWDKGCEHYFGNNRVVRHFSIFRHPLPRKLSFFYHFHVRNEGRNEKNVPREEVLRFVLGEGLPSDPRSRDAGPNYYASRLISDGTSGFDETHQYVLSSHKAQDEAIALVRKRIRERFAFVGLQLQSPVNQCMLQKISQVYGHVHGIDTLVGTTGLAEPKQRLNAGGYPWTAKKLWDSMSPGQRARFREVERVDLAIYDTVVQRFKDDAKAFHCENLVAVDNYAEDIFPN